MASNYEFGGRPVTGVHLLLLISEMEGTYQHLKYMGFEEDMTTIDNMKKSIIVFTSRLPSKKNSILSRLQRQRHRVNRLVVGSNPTWGVI